MFGQGFNYGFISGGPPCFTDTTDIFKDNSGVALYTLDYDGSDAGGASGKFGESAVLTGTSSQINFPNIPLSAFDAAAVSVSLWVNMQAVVSGYTSGSYVFRGRGNWIIQMISSGIVFQKYDTGPGNNGNNDLSYNFPGGTNLNQWYHIVVTDNGTSTSGLNLYVDGVLRDSNSGYANIDDNSWLAGIANYAGRAGGNFKVDQLRIFNKELLASEVTTLYNETKNTTNTLQILGDTSCIATYTFDGSSTDLSGNYNGTDTNILYRYDGTPTAVDFGVGGKSLYGARFNGSSSRIQISSTPTVPLDVSSGNFSISMWVNPSNLTNNNKLIYKWGTSATLRSWLATITTSGVLYVVEGTTAGDTLMLGTAAISTNVWTHIAITRTQGGNLVQYINGVATNTFSTQNRSLKTSTEPLYIGYQAGQTTNFTGSIDQVRIFNKAISAAEVSKLYGNGAGEIACAYTSTTDNVALPITNTAYYKLDNNSKDSAKSRGKFNQGATFVGNSAGIVNTTLQLSSTAHSVSLWMKPQDLTATKWQIMFFSAFNGYPSFTLGKRPDQTTSFHYRNESSNEVYFTLSNANTWYHVVVTRNNSGSTIYVNGSSVATDSNSMGTYSSSFYEKASIGSNPLYPAEYFDGTLDQIRVYDVALTSTDVANLYNSETTSTTNTLAFPTGKTAIATYTLDGNGVDVSGNYSGDEGDNIVYAYDGTDTNVEYRFGRYGQAAVFSANGYISGLPTVENTSGEFSISLWFNTTVNPSVQHTMLGGIKEQGTNDSVVAFKMLNDGYSKFYLRGTDGTLHILADTVDATDGNWHHLVGTVSSSIGVFYVDGQQVDSATISNNITVDNLLIGAENNRATLSPVNYFNGSIDQVRIYDAALTSSQVTQLYNEKPEVDTSNFKTVLYKGTGVTQYISNVGIDLETNGGLVWTKSRDNSYDHNWVDSVRGINTNGTLFALSSNLTGAQTDSVNNVLSLDANGFTVQNAGSRTNTNNQNYVSWVWKGGGDAVSNTDGSITSQVSANTTAGFSIVKYTGNGDNDFQNVGTGLSQECDIVFIKNLTSFGISWVVQRNKTDTSKYLYLNDTRRESTSSAFQVDINTNEGTFGFTSDNRGVNEQGDEYIAYCWHSVSGYSQIGSYSGSSSTVTISTGFEPSLLIIKRIDASGSWYMFDNKRSISPDNDDFLRAEDYDNESLNETDHPMFYSDRIEILSGSEGINDNFNSYIYMTFK